MTNGWQYYNHALIPTCWPHEEADTTVLKQKDIWKKSCGGALFARWTSDWDCGRETGFWACILDHPFDIMSLNANRRYKITKGRRYFYTKLIGAESVREMYDVYVEALEGYPGHPVPEDEKIWCSGWTRAMAEEGVSMIGAYDWETDRLCGYAHCIENGRYIPISSFKSRVSEEKRNVNFALMDGICEHYKDNLANGAYLCDGWRNVLHQTAFQDWLENFFQFRKAYCVLNMKYRPIVGLIVHMLYPFRGKLKRFRKVYAILELEEFSRMG